MGRTAEAAHAFCASPQAFSSFVGAGVETAAFALRPAAKPLWGPENMVFLEGRLYAPADRP
jgi:hypothetical protein